MNERLASPFLPGDRPISTERAVAALDFLLDDLRSDVSPGNADMLIQYAIARYQRGEIEGARQTLMHHMDLTAVYRVEAILHAPTNEETDMPKPTFTVTVEMTIAAPTAALASTYARRIMTSNKARIDEHTLPSDDMIWVDWSTQQAVPVATAG